eukprot:6479100-Amphidinium_carterae.2
MPHRKQQGVVAKDKLKAKIEQRVPAVGDEEQHTPTELATPRFRRANDLQDHEMVEVSDECLALAVPEKNTDQIEHNVPGASPKKKARPPQPIVDLEREQHATVTNSTSAPATLPSDMSVSEKLDAIYSSLMARVNTLESRDLQVEQRLSVVGGMDMRLKKLETQVSALIDGLPTVRPEAHKQATPPPPQTEDAWMRYKQKGQARARSTSPVVKETSRMHWGTGAPGMTRASSQSHGKTGERSLSANLPSTRQRVPDPKKIFISGFAKLSHMEVQLLVARSCNFGARVSQVNLRTRGLYNSTASLLFDSEEEASTYLKYFRAAKPCLNGKPLFASRDTSDENLRANWILRVGRRELIQSGVAQDSVRLHVPSKSLYVNRNTVLWVRRQQVFFAGEGEKIAETVRDSWESGG